MQDPDRLDEEARAYALAFLRQEETSRFRLLGCAHYPTNRAFLWVLEAAYLLCAGEERNATAVRLLRLALKEIERPN
jgi:hypothetical protein